MRRITDKDLDGMTNRLNRVTGSPLTYWREQDGQRVINVGHYYVDRAYGGCQLVRVTTAGGGVTTPLYSGHVSKRECYEQVYAFLRGIETVQEREAA